MESLWKRTVSPQSFQNLWRHNLNKKQLQQTYISYTRNVYLVYNKHISHIQQTYLIYHAQPDISRSNGNEEIKLGQLVEYKVRYIFLQELRQK